MRRRMLPEGWYSTSPEVITREIELWTSRKAAVETGAVSGIAPHAGWYFSGELAWLTWASAVEADIIVIAGGHAPSGYPVLVWDDDAYEVPGGKLMVHLDLLAELKNHFSARTDTTADNTIEVHLPFAAHRFSNASVLGLRVPADTRAFELGQFFSEYSIRNKQTVFVLGSTDLTHYGPNYGFSPAGVGEEAKQWAKRNDDRFIEACLSMNSNDILHTGNECMAACSPGAAACASSFAQAQGATRPVLHAYETSLSKHRNASFVGYCSISYYT